MSRLLTFHDRTTSHKREVVLGIAWLVAQRPGRLYEASPRDRGTLTTRLVNDLGRAGLKLDSASPAGEVARALKWLEANSYALCSRSQDSNYTAVMLAEDVEVPMPAFRVAQMALAASKANPSTRAEVADITSGYHRALAEASRADQPINGTAAPRPPLPSPAPPWLRPLEAKLRAWHRTDPRGAEQWAAEVIEALP